MSVFVIIWEKLSINHITTHSFSDERPTNFTIQMLKCAFEKVDAKTIQKRDKKKKKTRWFYDQSKDILRSWLAYSICALSFVTTTGFEKKGKLKMLIFDIISSRLVMLMWFFFLLFFVIYFSFYVLYLWTVDWCITMYEILLLQF